MLSMVKDAPVRAVDPEQLSAAFEIFMEHDVSDDRCEPVPVDRLHELLDDISGMLGTDRGVTLDLFWRCCAIGNFFSSETNRMHFGLDEGKPGPGVWAAAASAPVHEILFEDIPARSFSLEEFSAAVRARAN
jgi:hypothetical protein